MLFRSSGIRLSVRIRSPSSTDKVESASTWNPESKLRRGIEKPRQSCMVFPWGVIEIFRRLPFTQSVDNLGKR